MDIESHLQRQSDVKKMLKQKHPEAAEYLAVFFDDRRLDLDLAAAELPIKNPADATKGAEYLKNVLEKKDVPWESIGAIANISRIALPNEVATWKWLQELIEVWEGKVSQEASDFWEKNKDTKPLLGALL